MLKSRTPVYMLNQVFKINNVLADLNRSHALKRFGTIGLMLSFGICAIVSGVPLSSSELSAAEAPVRSAGERVRVDGKFVTVLAEGSADAAPDLAVIQMHFTSFGWTVDKSRKKVDALIQKFMDKLAEKGVKPAALKIGDVRLKPSYQFNRDLKVNVPADFLVSRKITLKIETLADVEKVLDSSLSVGSFLLESIRLTVKDPRELEKKAFDAAFAVGKIKAGDIAKSLGAELGAVASVTELDHQVTDMNMLQDNDFSMSAANQLAKAAQGGNAKDGSDEGTPSVLSGEGFLGLEKDPGAASPQSRDAVTAASKLEVTFSLR